MAKNMKPYFDAAVKNIVSHGDTDIFPYPIENHVLFDSEKELVKLLRNAYSNFDEYFAVNSPSHITTLSPVGYTGFRWASQLDPFWNAYFLGVVLAIAEEIESSRIPIKNKTIFSYRINPVGKKSKIFDDKIGWPEFVERSKELASEHNYVLCVDIADCYTRIPHHRLENALKQLKIRNSGPAHIKEILSNFSDTRSTGVPIGGPAARILVELVLNMTDKLLASNGVIFCRFADDYHEFCKSHDDAYAKLTFISEKLLRNERLSLQKAKTRIMSSEEFLSAQSILETREDDDDHTDERDFMNISLRYDPYSDDRDERYDQLKAELKKFDILGMLNRELQKTRTHGVLAKRLIKSIQHLKKPVKNNAALTLIENLDILYPLFPIVATTIKSIFFELPDVTQNKICQVLREGISSRNHVFQIEMHLAYAARVLGESKTPENEDALVDIFNNSTSNMVRRDVILIMSKWRVFYWLSDLMNDFNSLGAWERRAFIIASYQLDDAGSHWRDHMKNRFNDFELLVRDWAAEKSQIKEWQVPI